MSAPKLQKLPMRQLPLTQQSPEERPVNVQISAANEKIIMTDWAQMANRYIFERGEYSDLAQANVDALEGLKEFTLINPEEDKKSGSIMHRALGRLNYVKNILAITRNAIEIFGATHNCHFPNAVALSNALLTTGKTENHEAFSDEVAVMTQALIGRGIHCEIPQMKDIDFLSIKMATSSIFTQRELEYPSVKAPKYGFGS